jgi:ribosomal protein S18 acetylase RimI-like enzyme
MLEIRSLAGVGWEALAAAFNAAFADYVVPMVMTPASLAAMQHRRGYDAACSFGAFDGEHLVGFVLTCLDGDRAYNSGTGVVAAHRRGGLARRLVEAVIARATETGRMRSYVLEVIDSNAGAAALYRGLGFVETRGLACWGYAPEAASGDPAIAPLPAPDLDALAAELEVEPSWQNSFASIRRATEPYVALGDEHGLAIVFPATGDLPLLCVRRDARRRGHGRRLLDAAYAHAGRPLRIINLDERATGVAAFLAATGATPRVRQLEMVRPL